MQNIQIRLFNHNNEKYCVMDSMKTVMEASVLPTDTPQWSMHVLYIWPNCERLILPRIVYPKSQLIVKMSGIRSFLRKTHLASPPLADCQGLLIGNTYVYICLCVYKYMSTYVDLPEPPQIALGGFLYITEMGALIFDTRTKTWQKRATVMLK